MSNTVGRALKLLSLISEADRPLGLLQLAELGGLDKTTAARLLATLAEHRFVSRSAEKKYKLGIGLFSLSTNFIRRHDLRQIIQPNLRRIRDATRETVSFHLLVEDARVCLDGIESPEDVRRGVPHGEVHPLHEGPTGKVILAAMLPRQQADVMAKLGLQSKDLADLQRQLTVGSSQGYIASSDDRALGFSGLSAPVFNTDGVCGSVTVAGPKERWTSVRMNKYAATFVREVGQLTNELGGQSNIPAPPDRTLKPRRIAVPGIDAPAAAKLVSPFAGSGRR